MTETDYIKACIDLLITLISGLFMTMFGLIWLDTHNGVVSGDVRFLI